jgi:hypothetical protein
LQEHPEVALFFSDVRNLASPNTQRRFKMKRFVGALALVGVLSISSFAGDIPTDGSPAPCSECSAVGEPLPGEIPSGGIADVVREGLLDLFTALNSLAI